MILVTGATGTIGSALLAELAAAGAPARAARRGDGALAHAAETVALDMARPETLHPAVRGVQTLFLLGAMSVDQTRHELATVNAALEAGVRRIVKLSVWRADEELTPIARLHRPVERAIEAADVAWTFLRPNFFMQNFARGMARGIVERGVIEQPASDAPISFVDARDVARAAAAVLTTGGHDGAVYDLTGPAALGYGDAAAVFSRVLGREIRYVALGEARARAGMLAAGSPPFVVDALLSVSAAYRDGGAQRLSPAVGELTGRPPTALASFVADHRATFTA